MNESPLDKLLHSKKYRDVCPDTIRRVVDECLLKYKKPRDAEKAAREKLHGVTSAFMSETEYRRARRLCDDFSAESLEELLGCHASTRERLPLAAIDALYARIFSVIGTPDSLLDLACGIDPVYFLAKYPNMRIIGVDISGQSIDIIARCGGVAIHGDLLCENAVPRERFDAALLFKILPLLERQRAGSAMDVMRSVNAAHLIVSFPTRTLGGRSVGMEENYSRWMESHLPENRTIVDRFASENELFYILNEL